MPNTENVFPRNIVNPRSRITLCYNNITEHKSDPEHGHDFFEIAYVLSGRGVNIVNGQSFEIEQGTLNIMQYNDVHFYRPAKDSELTIMNILILPELVKENAYINRIISGGISKNGVTFQIPFQNITEFEALLYTMKKEYDNRNAYYEQMLVRYLEIFTMYIVRYSEQDVNKQYNEILMNVERHIFSNWDCSLKNIARLYNYNPNYFSTLFKKITGVKYSEYIDNRRIEIAKTKLLYTKDNIDDICRSSGFKEKKHFYQAFKKYVGLTPGQFRKSQIRNTSLSPDKIKFYDIFSP